MSRNDFVTYKAQILKNLQDGIDFSPKGSIDAPIMALVDRINSHPSYVTTSSCSGRLSVSYHWNDKNKKGVNWLLVKHGTIKYDEVVAALGSLSSLEIAPKLVYLKAEALILHICCENLDSAKDLHALAMQCGYRESGISISSSNKIMLAIRTSSFSMDMPLAINGRPFLSSSDLELIISEANSVLLNNFARTDKLLIAVKDSFSKGIQVRIGDHVVLLCSGGKQSLTKPLPILSAHRLLANTTLLTTKSDPKHNSSSTSTSSSSAVNGAQYYSLSTDSFTVRHAGQVPAGGRDATQIFRDCYFATISLGDERGEHGDAVLSCTWQLLDAAGGRHCETDILQRFHHAASVVHTHIHDSHVSEVCVYGGLRSVDVTLPIPDGDVVHVLVDTDANTYAARLVSTELPPVCGHSMIDIGAKCLVVVGGMPRELDAVVGGRVLDYFADESGEFTVASRSASQSLQGQVKCLQCLCHATDLPAPDANGFVFVGGGGVCLSFGPHQCQPVALHTHWGRESMQTEAAVLKCSKVGKDAKGEESAERELSADCRVSVLLVPRSLTKAWKVCLEQHGLLSKTLKIFAVSHPTASSPLLPVTSIGRALPSAAAGELAEGVEYMALPLIFRHDATDQELDALSSVGSLPSTEGVFYTTLPLPLSASTSSVSALKPQDKREASLEVLRRVWAQADIPASHLPAKFEKVGDILILPEQTFSSAQGRALLARPHVELAEKMFRPLCALWDVRGVGWGRRVHTSPLRHSRTRLLYVVDKEPPGPLVSSGEGDGREDGEDDPVLDWGEDSWVTVKENHISFSFDLCKVMFCSGNNTERMRMGSLRIPSEVVVDLFCGIGYYTVPLLVHASARRVHACEINPHSVAALRRNLLAHDVADRCVIHEGDNRLTTHGLQGVASRVLCGLLPSSKGGWAVAMYVLSKDGGVIHIHENVHEKEIVSFTEEARSEIERLSRDAGKEMQVRVGHVERVKSYAPRVLHVVVDLYCVPVSY
eukprot:gene28786-34751_t